MSGFENLRVVDNFYSSQAFRQAHEHNNIIRSMSKVGTPTDNAIIEALNDWIKEEQYLDFNLETVEDVPKLLDEYVYYFNNRRPAAALGFWNYTVFSVYFYLTDAQPKWQGLVISSTWACASGFGSDRFILVQQCEWCCDNRRTKDSPCQRRLAA